MAMQVSQVVDDLVAKLRTSYPVFTDNIRAFRTGVRVESDEHLDIVVGAFNGATSDEPQGVAESLACHVEISAVIRWSMQSRQTVDIFHPGDIAASLWAWGHNRYIEGCLRPLLPVRWGYFNDPEDLRRARFQAVWLAEIPLTPDIDQQFPDIPAFNAGDSGDLTPPLRNLNVNEDGTTRRIGP